MKEILKQIAARLATSEAYANPDVEFKKLGFKPAGHSGGGAGGGLDYYKPNAQLTKEGWGGYFYIDYIHGVGVTDSSKMELNVKLVRPDGSKFEYKFSSKSTTKLIDAFKKRFKSK